MSSEYLYRVSSQKGKLLTVRVDEETLLDFQAACDLRGATMSSYLHQYVIKTIREEKETDNLAFAKARKAAYAKYKKRSSEKSAQVKIPVHLANEIDKNHPANAKQTGKK